jgi:hypothetical protein
MRPADRDDDAARATRATRGVQSKQTTLVHRLAVERRRDPVREAVGAVDPAGEPVDLQS